jgi:hypothetical protein
MPEFIIVWWLFATIYLFTWPALVIIVLLGLILEANDRYIISVWLAGFMLYAIWNLFALTFSIPYIWVAFLVYPVLGFIYAPYRWLRFCERRVRKNNELPIKTEEDADRGRYSGFRKNREEMAKDIDFKKHLDRITCWVFAWPLSAIECLIGDMWREAQRIITDVCGKIYRGIEARALRLVEFHLPESDTETDGEAGC